MLQICATFTKFEGKEPVMTQIRVLLVSAMLSVAVGCGSGGLQLTDISGDVAFDGLPVPAGEIEFYPKDPELPKGYAEIVDGQYDTSLEGGKGIVLGEYEVRVSGYPQALVPEEDEIAAAEQELVEPLFLGYPVSATISSERHDVYVPSDARGHGWEHSSAGSDETSQAGAAAP